MWSGEQSLDIDTHGLCGIEDGHVGQHLLVISAPFGEPVAQVLVGEQTASAVGVVDDRRLKYGPSGALVSTR